MFKSVFLGVLFAFFPIFSFSQEASYGNQAGYTCQVNQNCLQFVNEVLLDKTENRGIYQYCKISYENIKDCCIDPMNCGESFAKDFPETLRASSLNLLQSAGAGLSCQMSKLSGLISSLSGVQTEFCSLGVENCKIECENKLEELRSYFRQCFSIPERYSIDEVLEKATAPPAGEEDCYERMKETAKKYESQSLDKKAKLREELKAKDIIKCEEIQKAKTKKNLQSLALNVCHEGERKRQAEEERQALKEKREQERKRLEQKQAEQKQAEQKVKQKKMEQELLAYSRLEQARRAEQTQLEGAGKKQAPAKAKKQAPAKTPAPTAEKTELESKTSPAKSKEQALEKAKIPIAEKAKPESKTPQAETKEPAPAVKKTGLESQSAPAKSKANPSKIKKHALAKTKKKASARTKAKPSSSPSNPNKKQKPVVKQNPATIQAKTQATGAGKKVKAKKTKAIQKTKTHTKKKTRSKVKKSGLKKTTQSTKQPAKKASLKGGLREDQLKSSSKNKLQTAQAEANLGNCPVSMPEIRSAIVFQSVEAPQIEPMKQQDWFPYDDYDLVQGKPAGVLVHLNKGRMNKQKEFAMDLNISGENKSRRRCFHEPMKGEMVRGQEFFCSFTREDLIKKGDFKFFPLPMYKEVLNENDIDRRVTITLFPKGYANNKSCHETTSFKVKVIKTHDLKIGFTRIGGGCYLSSSYDRVKEFAHSTEARINIRGMFPIKKLLSSALIYKWKEQDWDYVKGACNNNFHKERRKLTEGILSDVAELERLRASEGYHKLIAIVPENYLSFHKRYNLAGFVISPRWRYWRWYWFFGTRWYKSGFLGGSWNIAFVHQSELDKGTVAHELAHTVGQGKEFYEKENTDCRQFRGDPSQVCEDYEIPRALKTWADGGIRRWEFVKDKYSIMSGKIKIGKRDTDIHDLWIDRDTYQKIFKVLSEKAVIPNTEELFGWSIVNSDYIKRRHKEKASLKAVVVGFYNEEERSFMASSVKAQYTKLFTPSLYPNTENTKLPVVTFQLKEGERALKTIKQPVLKMQMKTLYKNETSKTEPLGISPLMAAFKLPLDYQQRNLRIVILDPWKKKISSISLKKE